VAVRQQASGIKNNWRQTRDQAKLFDTHMIITRVP